MSSPLSSALLLIFLLCLPLIAIAQQFDSDSASDAAVTVYSNNNVNLGNLDNLDDGGGGGGNDGGGGGGGGESKLQGPNVCTKQEP